MTGAGAISDSASTAASWPHSYNSASAPDTGNVLQIWYVFKHLHSCRIANVAFVTVLTLSILCERSIFFDLNKPVCSEALH